MKKLYSLLAAALVSMSAMAQVSVDNLAGKYVLEGDEPTYYIEDHGFQTDNIVILDRTGNNTFALDNFYYDMSDYDGNRITLNGTFQDLGEWASYPTVQDIQFTYDATNVFFYNPYAETEDTEWFFPYYNSFRLLTQLDEAGNPNLYLWPNNSILLTYYTAADENWGNKALEFVNKGAWNAETNPVGSLHLKRLPQYQTVSKRGLAGDYTVQGKDADGNAVSYNVNIALDGTEYIMTGLFGADAPAITFTWDDTDAGIRAQSVYNYDGEGNLTSYVESYAPNTNIYVSFTEDGNLSFDHSLYYYDGTNEYYLLEASTAEAGGQETNVLDQFAGKYLFTGESPYCDDEAYAPAENYECEITVEGNVLHMTGFLGTVDNETKPYYVGYYDEVNNTITFNCADNANDGEYVFDANTGVWYYDYGFTVNVDKNAAGHITLSREGNYYFYAYNNGWLTACYSSLFFEKDGKMPESTIDLSMFDGDYTFTGSNPTSEYADCMPAETYQCNITSENGKLYMTGFLGEVASETAPYYVGTYNQAAGKVYFMCANSVNGEYVQDGDNWFYVYDFTLNVNKEGEKVVSLTEEGTWYFYSHDADWNYYLASYDSMTFTKNGGEDAISSVEANASSDVYYDLQGRRMTTAPQKGMYIINGKKVIK